MNIVYQKIKLSAGYISAKMELRGEKLIDSCCKKHIIKQKTTAK